MYEDFYGFTEKPFNLTPDPKFLYLSPRHAEALAHLEYGRRERGGFILVTGEVGTGKTTLARHFLNLLPANTATAVVLYPALSAVELLRSILDDFHVALTGPSLKDHVDALHRFLLAARREGRDVILLLDEAQDLAADVLEQVRLLSNLETNTDKLIQIVLMGQSELRELLNRSELRQLAQRITARYHLDPLAANETESYVRHRLAVAGGDGKVSFTAGALAALHQLSGGVPRVVNLICDRALLAGYVKGAREIHAAMIHQAASEVLGDRRGKPATRRWAVLGVAAAGAALLLASLALPRTLRAPEALPTAIPTAAAVAAVTVAAPSPPTEDPRLEQMLLAVPRDASLQASLQRVQSLWGGPPLERTSLRTHLDQVRRLDLPVVLELFHPARRDTAFVALVGLDGAEAEVAVGDAPPVRVSVGALDRLWTRDAVYLWKDVQAVSGRDGAGRATTFAREALERLGYKNEEDLSRLVGRFQHDQDLVPDGVIGSRTLMTLYRLGPYPRPRLKVEQGTGVS